jgi:Zn-dependent protease with chaperone function
MKFKTFTLALLSGGVGLILGSCQQDISEIKADPKIKVENTSNLTTEEALLAINANAIAKIKFDCSTDALSNKLLALSANAAVAPSECSLTELDKTIGSYLQQFGPLEQQFFGSYITVNQLATILDTDPQYFGALGENTKLVEKQKKGLEKFWQMPGQVRINAQHNATLDNRDKIAGVYMVFAGYPSSLAYAVADQLLMVNQMSPVFVETPLLSFDAFATTDKLIVLGDGFMQVLAESGVENEVGVSGVLAHEWGHQVQFNNFQPWYGVAKEAFVPTPESTRQIELEADFFTGYYLTHQKGGTKNWKNAAEFFELFYKLGDCSFASEGHHGTPNQRLAASRLGYLVSLVTSRANLNASDVHTIFMATYNSILENKIAPKAILAGLKSTYLKVIFASIMLHEKEVKGIMNGHLSKTQIKDLKD